ncbi:hypothetical protein HYW75_04790 [Candidatus Pacearchaeota archaeon]|nr:hypothetical protein [Candidatus Pacearchaeota archaeon]
MVKVGVIGHTGRLGKPLVELICNHPGAELVYTESRKEGADGDLESVDCMFFTLPKGESEQYLTKCKEKRLIDLSEDHRDNSRWVYGLSEMNREEIKAARRVANPGCYATSVILGLLPIKGCVSQINISSTSGISGAGLEVIKIDQFLIYKEGREHPHLKEITAALAYNQESPGEILFVPQRIDNTDRGIISTIFSTFSGFGPIQEKYDTFYKNNPFVSMVKKIETRAVNNTNRCHIKVSEFGERLIILSALDNILKGGSGQAIQNFNIMYGFDETLGLPL